MSLFIPFLTLFFVFLTACSPTDKKVTPDKQSGGVDEFGFKAPPEDYRNVLFSLKSALGDLNILNLVTNESAAREARENWTVRKFETTSVVRDENGENTESYLNYELLPKKSEVNTTETEKSKSVERDLTHFKISHSMSWRIGVRKAKDGNINTIIMRNIDGNVQSIDKSLNSDVVLTTAERNVKISIEPTGVKVESTALYLSSDKILKNNFNKLVTTLNLKSESGIEVQNLQSISDVKNLISKLSIGSFESALLRRGRADYDILYKMKTEKLVLKENENCWDLEGVVSFNFSKGKSASKSDKYTNMNISAELASVGKVNYRHLNCKDLDGALDVTPLLQN